MLHAGARGKGVDHDPLAAVRGGSGGRGDGAFEPVRTRVICRAARVWCRTIGKRQQITLPPASGLFVYTHQFCHIQLQRFRIVLCASGCGARLLSPCIPARLARARVRWLLPVARAIGVVTLCARADDDAPGVAGPACAASLGSASPFSWRRYRRVRQRRLDASPEQVSLPVLCPSPFRWPSSCARAAASGGS